MARTALVPRLAACLLAGMASLGAAQPPASVPVPQVSGVFRCARAALEGYAFPVNGLALSVGTVYRPGIGDLFELTVVNPSAGFVFFNPMDLAVVDAFGFQVCLDTDAPFRVAPGAFARRAYRIVPNGPEGFAPVPRLKLPARICFADQVLAEISE
jgi:hypothetical protein